VQNVSLRDSACLVEAARMNGIRQAHRSTFGGFSTLNLMVSVIETPPKVWMVWLVNQTTIVYQARPPGTLRSGAQGPTNLTACRAWSPSIWG
jgi:hypothetical protein